MQVNFDNTRSVQNLADKLGLRYPDGIPISKNIRSSVTDYDIRIGDRVRVKVADSNLKQGVTGIVKSVSHNGNGMTSVLLYGVWVFAKDLEIVVTSGRNPNETQADLESLTIAELKRKVKNRQTQSGLKVKNLSKLRKNQLISILLYG